MIGVIPAAGKASRFGGVQKELLPVGPDKCMLDAACYRAWDLGADKLVVVTRPSKHDAQAQRLQQSGIDATFVYQSNDDDLWGAIKTALANWDDDMLLVLPDTIWTTETEQLPESDFGFGLFKTFEPEKYSMVLNGRVLTKNPLVAGTLQRCWGVAWWSKAVGRFWDHHDFGSYDEAFQFAMDGYGYKKFELEDYYDLGSWERYKEYICSLSTS